MEQIRGFDEVLTDLRAGRTLDELSQYLREATEAAKRTGKMATVQLTLKIKPQGDRQVEVLDTVTRKIPEPNRHPTIMFVDENGNMTRNDARQMRIDDLQVVQEKKAEIVLLDKQSGEIKEVGIQ